MVVDFAGAAIKVGIAVFTKATVVGFFEDQFPHWSFVTLSGLYVGIESSLCEFGLTLLLVLFWRAPGRTRGNAPAFQEGRAVELRENELPYEKGDGS
ncbi:MAG: hypothetical protein R6V12_18960 [Candidatus Hydrogenedentota bacterium]